MNNQLIDALTRLANCVDYVTRFAQGDIYAQSIMKDLRDQLDAAKNDSNADIVRIIDDVVLANGGGVQWFPNEHKYGRDGGTK